MRFESKEVKMFFFLFEQTHPLLYTLLLLIWIWSSKKYCKSSFGSPMVMKIFPKTKKLQRYDRCMVIGMSTLFINYVILT
jgi:hypothetical protein